MFKLNELKITPKLFIGFGALLAVTAGIATACVLGFNTVSVNVAKSDAIAQSATRALEVEGLFEKMQRSILRYAYDHDEASMKEFGQRATEAVAELQTAEKATPFEERRKSYRALETDVSSVQALAAKLIGAVQQNIGVQAKLYTLGDELTANTRKLVSQVQSLDDPALSAAAAKIDSQLLSVRVANWRGQATLDPKGVSILEQATSDAINAIEALGKSDLPEDVRASIEPLKHSLTDYAASAKTMLEGLVAVGDIYSKELAPATTQMQATIQTTNSQLQDEFGTTQASTAKTVVGAQLFAEIAAVFGLLLGLVIALRVAQSIKRPVVNLTSAMDLLANGDLDAAIPNTADPNEIGDMARSVLVFKENAVERQRLEAEAAANRAAAEADRERASFEQRQRDAEQAAVVGSLADSLTKVAGGDLTTRIDAEFTGRYGQIRSDFNGAVARLEAAMQKVAQGTDAIHAGSQDISTAADDLSRRTEQQAASLEETAAAVEEITQTVKKAAEGANHAREVVAAANDDARKSSLVVREAVEAMDTIAKSAGQISQIIGVIDEIAFQTNLLALNAGVEAARAGDAGRGFAVVASEVRALAQRSAEAAKEIKGLISVSTMQVEQGVKLVGDTGKSLERMLAQVGEINDIVTSIASGAKEQATGLGEVNTAITRMDQVTQQNASMVEESTAASHSLSHETEQLSSLIGQFRLGRGTDHEALRRQLQKVAPHAFQQAKAAVGSPRSARPVARRAMVVNGAAVEAEAEDWNEF